jgi:hypothetical protein
MGLIDSTQHSTNLGRATHDEILALAEAHGMDAGEYRRHLIVRAVDQALAEFRAAHGISPHEWIERQKKGDRTNTKPSAPPTADDTECKP